MVHTVVSLAERPELEERAVFGAGWPKFIFHDPVARRYMGTADRVFRDLNLVVLDERDEIVAGGWAVAFAWDGTREDLPAGWDGALERAVVHHEGGAEPNTLAPMAAEVPAAHRGKGLSRQVLSALRARARERGFSMIAPARPTLKHRYPLTPMARYAAWTNADGEPFDPWLRTHYRLGAEVFAVAPVAMVIEGTVAQWERWTGMRFPETGGYVVPEALDVVDIDVEADAGRYVEAAVWMRHSLG